MTINEELLLGWKSEVHVALATHKSRLVLHGNVLDDVVWRDGAAMPLVAWLVERLCEQGHRRVVHYDFQGHPRVLAWDDRAPGGNFAELMQESPDSAQRTNRAPIAGDSPEFALLALAQALRSPAAPMVAIVSRAEHAVATPSASAVALQKLSEDAARCPDQDGRLLQNLAIHVYTRETAIPSEFIQAEANCALVLVPRPSIVERSAFLRAELRQPHFRSVRFDPGQLARTTEGFRTLELRQLLLLSLTLEGQPDAGLQELLSLYRFGRKLDTWRSLDMGEAAKALRSTVLGQEEAVESVIDALYRAKHHTGELQGDVGDRPAMVLFFVGATGVGKTHLARALARFVTGNEENMKIIDMTEYQQDHSEQRLIGPPPGYVGHLEGGQLTNWVKERPRSLVLFDEVEKAHERILDIFFQVLEGARLTDGKGETVDFTETILVFTSNIGTQEGTEDLRSQGRGATVEHFVREVEEHFGDIERVELYNRLKTGVVVFNFVADELARSQLISRLRDMAEAAQRRLQQARAPDARIVFDVKRAEDAKVVEELMKLANVARYGLRDINNVLTLAVESAFGRYLDLDPRARPPRSRYFWSAERARVELVPDNG